MFHRCQRFTSNQYKVKRKGSNERSKENRSVPWSGAPDSLVCHRTVSGAPGRITLNLPHLGFWEMLSVIIHRTVRCSTGLSGVPAGATAISANGRLQVNSEQCDYARRSQSRRQKAHRTVNSDCPVAQLSEAPTVEP
jgi:hypothetical protein